jgi:hypothetical protein
MTLQFKGSYRKAFSFFVKPGNLFGKIKKAGYKPGVFNGFNIF